jgi:hypothetical protein
VHDQSTIFTTLAVAHRPKLDVFLAWHRNNCFITSNTYIPAIFGRGCPGAWEQAPSGTFLSLGGRNVEEWRLYALAE